MSVYYKKVKLPDGTTRDEHRLIMEQHLGRKLRTNQIVHHINGDMHDNRIENLEVMSRRNHAKLHLTGIKLSEERRQIMSTLHKGIPSPRTISDDQMRLAIKLYGEGEKKQDIEDRCGFSLSTMYKMMQGCGIRYKEFEKEIEAAKASRPLNQKPPNYHHRTPIYGSYYRPAVSKRCQPDQTEQSFNDSKNPTTAGAVGF